MPGPQDVMNRVAPCVGNRTVASRNLTLWTKIVIPPHSSVSSQRNHVTQSSPRLCDGNFLPS